MNEERERERERERDPNIVWSRAIACLLVVFGHTVQHISGKWLADFQGSAFWFPAKLITRSIIPFHNTAVPMFFMISGYLMFSKSTEFTYASAWRRFFKLYIPIIYFGTIYYIADTLMGNYYPYLTIFLSWGSIMGSIVYFLYDLLPLYILSLFISLPQYTETKDKVRLLVVVMILFILTESTVAWPFTFSRLGVPLRTAFSFSLPFSYALTGYALKQFNAVRFPRNLKIGLWIGFILLCLERLYPASDKNARYFSLDVYLLSSVFFLAIQSIDIPKLISHRLGRWADDFLRFISKYSLGIFGWHGVFIWGTRYYLDKNIISYAVIGHPAIIFMLTFCFALLMSIAGTAFSQTIRRWGGMLVKSTVK